MGRPTPHAATVDTGHAGHGSGSPSVPPGPAPASGSRAELPAPRLARAITVFCLGAVAFLAVVNVFAEHLDAAVLAACLACVAIVFTLQFLHTAPSARSWSSRRKTWTLATQAVFTYLPMAAFGVGWGGMAGCLAASVLLALPRRTAWTLFFLIAASMATFPPLLGATAVQTVYVVVSTMLIGLVLYGLSRLHDLLHEVYAARAELARLAVADERLRFARDLHDLLGYSLSAITLKSELIHRLVPVRPEQALAETSALLQISRQALSDVRRVASSYRDMHLLDEVAAARSILASADIETSVDIDEEVSAAAHDLAPAADTVLATALREGVTNMLRHSRVRQCQIAVRTRGAQVELTMVNDGLPEPSLADAPDSGSGLGNLRSRLEHLGGRLVTEVRTGRFHLVATVPTAPDPAPGSDPPAGGSGTTHHGSDVSDSRSDRDYRGVRAGTVT